MSSPFSKVHAPSQPLNLTFVSATFSVEVARSHFEIGGAGATRLLMHQPVPVERLFMTYHETAAMNEQFKEAEVVMFWRETVCGEL